MDRQWQQFIDHIHEGQVKCNDLDMLHKLVLTPTEHPDFNQCPWSECVLITPRNSVQIWWNEVAAASWCERQHCQMYICRAEDTIQGQPLTQHQAQVLAIEKVWHEQLGTKKPPTLAREVKLAVGIKVMVTENINPYLGIANRTRGTIVEIVLDIREQIDHMVPIVKLCYLPLYVLLKREGVEDEIDEEEKEVQGRFKNLPCSIVPIIAVGQTMMFMEHQHSGQVKWKREEWKQIPLELVYAFTDYCAQGQMIGNVIVDIGNPEDGILLLMFNLYVALSRSWGQDGICLLWDFDERLFNCRWDDELVQKDNRMHIMNQATKEKWEHGEGGEGEKDA